MIEKIMILIITELGPSGILICGLYFILKTAMKKICKELHQTNEKLSIIEKHMKAYAKLTGKNGHVQN